MERRTRCCAALLLLFGIATCWSKESSVKVGDVPPNFLGKDGGGKKVNVSDHRGKVLVISFFATWCGPCRNEVPVLANLQKAAGRDKLTIVAIDLKEDVTVVKKVRKLFKDYDLTFTHDYDGKISREFGVESIPHMVIVGADGRVAMKHVGYNEKSLKNVVDDINRVYRESLAASRKSVALD